MNLKMKLIIFNLIITKNIKLQNLKNIRNKVFMNI